MSTIDWSELSKKVNKKDRVEFASVKHLFHKVAQDVYEQKGSGGKLWELLEENDGKQYLVALYEDSEFVVESSEDSDEWLAASDSAGENITLSYKGFPLMRFAAKKYQFNKENSEDFARFIEKKARSEDQFVADLLDQVPQSKKAFVTNLLKGENS